MLSIVFIMKFSSDCHSFAFMALVSFASSFSTALLVDLKAAVPLKPRLDGNSLKSKMICSGIQVQTARRAVALGMRIISTMKQGLTISAELESLSQSQLINQIQIETKRQLQPFLIAKVLPDIYLLENECFDGFLITEASTGHIRSINDGKASPATINEEICGQIPTGNMASYPQLAE